MFILLDFDYRHLFRALFNVPVKRNKGLATLTNGSVINEKQLQLYGNFLNLRERVEFRKRIIGCDRVLFFPKWDLDGPDIRYFGEYNPPPENIHNLTSFRAGPWVLDGRQMVADAKDIGIMLAESVLYKTKDPVTIAIYSPFSTEFEAQRGWNLGRGPFDAFWSGIRKAADQIHLLYPFIQFLAVSDINPYVEITKVCHVQWKKKNEVEIVPNLFQAIPGDAFGLTGFSELEEEILLENKIPKEFLFNVLIFGAQIQNSYLVQKFRNDVWNPRARLGLLHSRQQNKYPCLSK